MIYPSYYYHDPQRTIKFKRERPKRKKTLRIKKGVKTYRLLKLRYERGDK